MAIITRGAETGALQYTIKTVDNVQLCREVQQLELSLQEIQKGSHKVRTTQAASNPRRLPCPDASAHRWCSPLVLTTGAHRWCHAFDIMLRPLLTWLCDAVAT